MSTQRCWAVKNGHRCPEPAAPGSRFCADHSRQPPPTPSIGQLPPEQAAPSSAHTDPSPPASASMPPLDWLLGMLQDAMAGVMADEVPPLQKANALSRLGNLYLKAYRVAQLVQENKVLAARVEALEEANTALAQRCADRERSWGERSDQRDKRSERWGEQRAAEREPHRATAAASKPLPAALASGKAPTRAGAVSDRPTTRDPTRRVDADREAERGHLVGKQKQRVSTELVAV
jgi:hypothetical protein